MPNWCGNRLFVKGDQRILAFIEKFNGGSDGFLEVFVPMPKELGGVTAPAKIITQAEYEKAQASEATAMEKMCGRGITQEMSARFKDEYGADNWYDWRVQNWGTKWDVSDLKWEREGFEFRLSFNTAWSPPVGGVQKISELYPSLSFELWYEEPGCNIEGQIVFLNGTVFDEIERDCEAWQSDGDDDEEGTFIPMEARFERLA